MSPFILVRRFCGGVADCPADHLMAASFTGVKIHSDSLLQLPDPIYYFFSSDFPRFFDLLDIVIGENPSLSFVFVLSWLGIGSFDLPSNINVLYGMMISQIVHNLILFKRIF